MVALLLDVDTVRTCKIYSVTCLVVHILFADIVDVATALAACTTVAAVIVVPSGVGAVLDVAEDCGYR